ncbi:MAG: DUF362 domain-containing protein [Asgard group archaeon]|nr:DUF362 domain-containing protein [Asgard group archaeon]
MITFIKNTCFYYDLIYLRGNIMSKVYFGSIQHGKPEVQASLAAKFDAIIEKLDLSSIEKKDKVAIKMHLGFRDGFQTIPVFFVRRLVQAIKKTGGYPFITDNPTAVYNAVNRGYTEETCGCPIIPVAGIKDQYVYPKEVNFKGVDSIDMAGVLHDADVLVNFAHAKGHGLCGFGGVIKNLALGGFAAKTRWNKIHSVVHYDKYWDSEKCTPEHAKKLVDSCPYKCINYDEKKHELKIGFYNCNQCMECIKADEGVGCLQIKQENLDAFQEFMAICAKNVLDTFDKKKLFNISIALQITAFCDCMGMPQPIVVNEIGVLGSKDTVAIEQATLDLIKKEGIIESGIPPYLKNINLDSGLHPFQILLGPMKDPYKVVEYAEKLGIGTSKYELLEILSPEETAKIDYSKHKYETEPTFF